MRELIYRDEAIDAIERIRSVDTYADLEYAKDIFRKIPTAQPEQRTGYFIGTEFDGYADGSPVYYEWECSECGCVFEDDEPTYNYCPNCGAKMVEK